MTKQEIISGLKNAVARGESIQKASQSFINAGYSPADVQQAASQINMGLASNISSSTQTPTHPQQSPIPHLSASNSLNAPSPSQPNEKINNNETKKPNFFSKLFKKKDKETKEKPVQQTNSEDPLTKKKKKPLWFIITLIIILIILFTVLGFVLFGTEIL